MGCSQRNRATVNRYSKIVFDGKVAFGFVQCEQTFKPGCVFICEWI